jgi:hypothetical protein
MIVTMRRMWCSICDKARMHECMKGLGKCVVCEYVRDHYQN